MSPDREATCAWDCQLPDDHTGPCGPAVVKLTWLELLQSSFDAMLVRMQGTDQREAVEKAFRASPEELGRAAVQHAHKAGETVCQHMDNPMFCKLCRALRDEQ